MNLSDQHTKRLESIEEKHREEVQNLQKRICSLENENKRLSGQIHYQLLLEQMRLNQRIGLNKIFGKIILSKK